MGIVYTSPPKDFSPSVQVSSCFCFAQDKLLLLQTNPYKKALANLWGVPAGKLSPGESPKDAILREMLEETGIKLSANKIFFVQTVYIKYPSFDFMFHIFKSTLVPQTQKLSLSPEHQSFKWVPIQEALEMNLIPGEKECIQLCCHIPTNLPITEKIRNYSFYQEKS